MEWVIAIAASAPVAGGLAYFFTRVVRLNDEAHAKMEAAIEELKTEMSAAKTQLAKICVKLDILLGDRKDGSK